MKTTRYTSLLSACIMLATIVSGCSSFGAEDDSIPNLTGEWTGSLVTPSGTTNGVLLNVTDVAGEITGYYREYIQLNNGRTQVTGGEMSGKAIARDRIEILLAGERLLQVQLNNSRMSGSYSLVSRPSRTGTVNVERAQ